MRNYFLFFALMISYNLWAQQDTISLEGVQLSDLNQLRYQNTKTIQTLNDSILKNYRGSSTELLNQESLLYFKESGAGMVSSPSFRGTNAQQTAVIWNGININSLLLGQTDFNVLSLNGSDEVRITAGGGSVAYGSSAIGGSIQLNHQFRFQPRFENLALLSYGSFNQLSAQVKSNYSTQNLALQLAVRHAQSENDFDLPKGRGKNSNGQHYSNAYDFAGAHRINPYHTLKFMASLTDVGRHFSLIIPTQTKTKYHDFNTRSLLEWNWKKGAWQSNTKLAYVSENYRFYPNSAQNNYTTGESEQWVAKYDILYQINKKSSLNVLLDFAAQTASGDAIQKVHRQLYGASLWWKQQLLPSLNYSVSVRQDYTEEYDNPLLYSLGAQWQVSDVYSVRLNASKNYRIPTFNDLYWEKSGNKNLQPETSYQIEIGNDWHWNGFVFTLNAYYNNMKDMIRWVPQGADWRPMNVGKVEIYGAEVLAKWNKTWKKQQLSTQAMYAYNHTEDVQLKKLLTYSPQHKANFSVAYRYNQWGINYFLQSIGKVHTRSDNDLRYQLDGYWLSNVQLTKYFGRKNHFQLSIGSKNIFDQRYEVVEDYSMPGRNYYIQMNIKF